MSIEEQVSELRKNILFNWTHLAHYGDQMFKAADTIEILSAVYKAADNYFVRSGVGIEGIGDRRILSDALDKANIHFAETGN